MALLLVLIGGFFALNMGGSGIVPSFSAALGARLITWKWAAICFFVFAGLGAMLFGASVAKTLGGALVPPSILTTKVVLVVMISTTSCMFLANLLKLPESTSWVTVASISTVGCMKGNLHTETLLYKLLPAWVLLPIVGFVLTSMVVRYLYPLQANSFRRHEFLLRHESSIQKFVLFSSCCVAVAIGSNNVANVVGPIAATGLVDVGGGLCLAAPVFGLGAFVFRAPIQSVGKEIVPLGPFTASLIKCVFGSLLLIASLLGIPQSSVQLSFACVLAVAFAKDDMRVVLSNPVIRRVVLLWFVNPLIACGMTVLLMWGLGA